VVALQGEATNRPQAAAVKSRGGERCGKKRLKGRRKRAWEFLAGVFTREPGLFAHWRVVRANDRMVGAV
jgi:hypothetical protein